MGFAAKRASFPAPTGATWHSFSAFSSTLRRATRGLPGEIRLFWPPLRLAQVRLCGLGSSDRTTSASSTRTRPAGGCAKGRRGSRKGAMSHFLDFRPAVCRGSGDLGTPGSGPRGGEARAFGRKPHGQSTRRNARNALVPSFPRAGPIRHQNNFCPRSPRFRRGILGTSHAGHPRSAPLGKSEKKRGKARNSEKKRGKARKARNCCLGSAQRAPGRTRAHRSSGCSPPKPPPACGPGAQQLLAPGQQSGVVWVLPDAHRPNHPIECWPGASMRGSKNAAKDLGQKLFR